MKRALLVVAVAASLALGDTAAAQDFQRTYRVGAGALIRIGNVSGDVTVTGYSGDVISVSGFKEGRDRDLVQIEDLSRADSIEVTARYPESCNCSASVRFEVQVPRGINYNFDRLASVSGDIEVSGVTGRLRAETVSGDARINDVVGLVSASTVSGDVEVEISRLEGTGDMKVSSVSGDVRVRMPANLDADIEMSSLSGSLKTDFPIEVQERRYGPGRSARGKLGAGSRSLRISTVSGRVSLLRN